MGRRGERRESCEEELAWPAVTQPAALIRTRTALICVQTAMTAMLVSSQASLSNLTQRTVLRLLCAINLPDGGQQHGRQQLRHG